MIVCEVHQSRLEIKSVIKHRLSQNPLLNLCKSVVINIAHKDGLVRY